MKPKTKTIKAFAVDNGHGEPMSDASRVLVFRLRRAAEELAALYHGDQKKVMRVDIIYHPKHKK